MSGRKILAGKAAKCTHNADVIGDPASTNRWWESGHARRETVERRRGRRDVEGCRSAAHGDRSLCSLELVDWAAPLEREGESLSTVSRVNPNIFGTINKHERA